MILYVIRFIASSNKISTIINDPCKMLKKYDSCQRRSVGAVRENFQSARVGDEALVYFALHLTCSVVVTWMYLPTSYEQFNLLVLLDAICLFVY